MKSEWISCHLSEIIEFRNGKSRPKNSGRIPVYGGNGILDYTNEFNCRKTIIIGRVGAYCGSVFLSLNPCWVSDNAISAVAKDNYDLIYLYYLLKSLNLNARHIGTSQPLLTQEILNNIECAIPPLATQRRIAAILSSLDDKIELNNKINANLQEQAQALFKSWFVDFEPWGGVMPEGWREEALGDIFELHRGYDLPKNKMTSGEYPVAGSTKTLFYHNEFTTSPPCIVLGRSGTIGNPRIYLEKCWVHNTSLYVSDFKSHNPFWIFYILRNIDYSQFNAGSAVPTLNRNHLYLNRVALPSLDIESKFGEIIKTICNQVNSNNKENRRLAELRDTLLPKLMSGELDVSDVELSEVSDA